MAEYTNVEKPFLEKLSQAHWQVIDQGQGIPVDPSKSLRSSFAEVALKAEFMRSVGALNNDWVVTPGNFYLLKLHFILLMETRINYILRKCLVEFLD